MDITRREVAAGLALAALWPRASRASTSEILHAVPALQRLAPDGRDPTPIWTYGGRAPGPELRVPRGGRLVRQLVNDLPAPTTIHWHGLRIDNGMDGVPGLTQEPVAPGGRFTYDFALPDAGTYWYHAHNQSWEQVARGLYGPLIVTESTPPDVDHDLPLVLADWRLDPGTAALVEDFGTPHDMAHAGRVGNVLTVNGAFVATQPVRRGARLRLINAGTDLVLGLGLHGLRGWIMALDGMPLKTPRPVSGSITLAPAQRIDLLADVTAPEGDTAALAQVTREGAFALADFPVTPGGSPRPAPPPLEPNRVPVPMRRGARSVILRMAGGAMAPLPGGMHHGAWQDRAGLAEAGQYWTLNGRAGMGGAPFMSLRRGETVRLRMINDTAFAHGLHLHGHHVHETTPEGDLGDLRDTTLVPARGERTVMLVADNPGRWMLHCHMLSHAGSGMMTWFQVV